MNPRIKKWILRFIIRFMLFTQILWLYPVQYYCPPALFYVFFSTLTQICRKTYFFLKPKPSKKWNWYTFFPCTNFHHDYLVFWKFYAYLVCGKFLSFLYLCCKTNHGFFNILLKLFVSISMKRTWPNVQLPNTTENFYFKRKTCIVLYEFSCWTLLLESLILLLLNQLLTDQCSLQATCMLILVICSTISRCRFHQFGLCKYFVIKKRDGSVLELSSLIVGFQKLVE